MVCKVREEFDSNVGQFLLRKPAFECNTLILVGTVGNSGRRVLVNSVACF